MIINTKTKIEVPSGCSTPEEYKRIADLAKKLLQEPKKDEAKRNAKRTVDNGQFGRDSA